MATGSARWLGTRLGRRLRGWWRAVGAGIAGMSGGAVVASVRIGSGAVAAAGGVLAAVVGRLHRTIGRRLAAAEGRAFAGVDEERLRTQGRTDLDGALENVDSRLAGRIDLDVVLRPSYRQQRAGRLHNA